MPAQFSSAVCKVFINAYVARIKFLNPIYMKEGYFAARKFQTDARLEDKHWLNLLE